MEFLPKIDIDLILSDYYLLSGTLVFIFSTLLFFIGIINYARARKKDTQFFIPPSGSGEDANLEYPEPPDTPPTANATGPSQPGPNIVEEAGNMGVDALETPHEVSSEAETTEVQNLMVRLDELEKRLAQIENSKEPASQNELKQPPTDPEDYTRKLLKLAEHVIVLENQMAKIRNGSAQPKNAEDPKPVGASTPATEPAAETPEPAPAAKPSSGDKPDEGEPPSSKSDKPPVMPL